MFTRPLVGWLQIAGNVGLIAGLILVAVQIQDSNRIASAEMFSASVDMGVSINTSQLGETPQKSMSTVLSEPEVATVEDMFVADRVYDAILRQLVRIHVFDELGLFGSETVTPQGYVQLHYEAFACPYGVGWLAPISPRLEWRTANLVSLRSSPTAVPRTANNRCGLMARVRPEDCRSARPTLESDFVAI